MDDQLATGNDALVEARDLSRYFDVSAWSAPDQWSSFYERARTV